MTGRGFAILTLPSSSLRGEHTASAMSQSQCTHDRPHNPLAERQTCRRGTSRAFGTGPQIKHGNMIQKETVPCVTPPLLGYQQVEVVPVHAKNLLQGGVAYLERTPVPRHRRRHRVCVASRTCVQHTQTRGVFRIRKICLSSSQNHVHKHEQRIAASHRTALTEPPNR